MIRFSNSFSFRAHDRVEVASAVVLATFRNADYEVLRRFLRRIAINKIAFCRGELLVPLGEVVLSRLRAIREHLTNGLFHEVERRSSARARSFSNRRNGNWKVARDEL